ncbi:ROK family protein [Actinokineospora soli]|uniref:ROK family protein n=1 Tax=Actinokineospora soli TaxID=1048753 RepID=A0ABW2TTR2_9PSEU
MAVPGTLRTLNDRAVLALLLDRGPMTRPQIAAASGLSKPTASQVLTRLTGLVVAEGTRVGLPGRNAEVYRVEPTAATAAAVDVTPRRIAVRVVRVTGEVVGEHVLPTPGRSGGDVVQRLRDAVTGAGVAPEDLDHVVVGVPGAVDPRTRRLAFAAHLPGWHRPGLVDWLADGLGADVVVENDVNLAAQAELATGDEPDFALYWGAEGIGAALVLDGRLRRGAGGGAGRSATSPSPARPPRATSGGWPCTGCSRARAGPRSAGCCAPTASAAVPPPRSAPPRTPTRRCWTRWRTASPSGSRPSSPWSTRAWSCSAATSCSRAANRCAPGSSTPCTP